MIVTQEKLRDALTKTLENSVWKKEGKDDRVRKFDETLDIIVNLRDLDIKNPNNRVNSEFLLPHQIQTPKTHKLCFFTKEDQLVDAKNAGFDVCDNEALNDLNKKDAKTKKKFVRQYDSFVARMDLMRDVARVLGRNLGQAGKMPKPLPKGYGIVNPNDPVDRIVANFMRRVVVQTKRAPIVQTKFGRKSMEFEQNFENLTALVEFLQNQLPNGQGNIKSIILKTTMGQPIRVEEEELRKKGKKGGKR
jgi:large subunit ribosomal protein L1